MQNQLVVQNKDAKLLEIEVKLKQKKDYFDNAVNKCLKMCKIFIFLSSCVCFACCYLLQDFQLKCSGSQLYNFVISVGLYSMINIMHHLCIVRCIMLRRGILMEKFLQENQNLDIIAQQQPVIQWNLYLEIQKMTYAIYVVKYFKNFAYYVIFIWGNLVYYQNSKSTCDENLKNITFIMISFGYIFSGFIVIGLALTFVSVLFYCPFLLIYVLYVKTNQYRQKRRLFKNIYTFKCASQDVSCRVCMYDFKYNERAYAPCKNSKQHCFHQQCLEKWLQLNFFCPICRTKF